jgi:hypothetical protein
MGEERRRKGAADVDVRVCREAPRECEAVDGESRRRPQIVPLFEEDPVLILGVEDGEFGAHFAHDDERRRALHHPNHSVFVPRSLVGPAVRPRADEESVVHPGGVDGRLDGRGIARPIHGDVPRAREALGAKRDEEDDRERDDKAQPGHRESPWLQRPVWERSVGSIQYNKGRVSKSTKAMVPLSGWVTASLPLLRGGASPCRNRTAPCRCSESHRHAADRKE